MITTTKPALTAAIANTENKLREALDNAMNLACPGLNHNMELAKLDMLLQELNAVHEAAADGAPRSWPVGGNVE
jgi:hypothetical protein